jgi:hypothetical protein
MVEGVLARCIFQRESLRSSMVRPNSRDPGIRQQREPPTTSIDSLLDPLSWFVTPFGADFGRAAGKTVNERAADLKLYQDVEDASLDLYAAVRNGYLQRRQKSIADAISSPILPSSALRSLASSAQSFGFVWISRRRLWTPRP